MVRSRKYVVLALGLLCLGAAGCGDDVSVSIVIGPTSPRVVAISPDNGAVNVDPATVVTATFSQDMEPASINTSTFRLRSANGGVDGTVSYDSSTRTARFRPLNPLALLTTYTVTLTQAVQSESGLNLPSAFIWSFTTLDGAGNVLTASAAGESPEDPGLPPDPGLAKGFESRVAAVSDGEALAVWAEADPSGKSRAMASRYDVEQELWSPPRRLGTGGGEGWNPRVAVDAQGNFDVVWDGEEGLSSRVFPAEKALTR